MACFARECEQRRGQQQSQGMVKLHIKNEDRSQFLFETTVEVPLAELVPQLVRLYNGRLKVDRLCQGSFVFGVHYLEHITILNFKSCLLFFESQCCIKVDFKEKSGHYLISHTDVPAAV